MTEDSVAMLCPSDVVILVMGLTGVGKSTFIEKLTGEDAGIGHGLVSATSGIGLYCYMSGHRRVFFVDTPGFDDTQHPDTKTFQEIAVLLTRIYALGLHLGGIIYLHRITDNRVSGSSMKSFNLLKNMCGPEGSKFTMLVTTMWNEMHFEDHEYGKACERENELRTVDEFWGSMMSQGSRIQRWQGTQASALSILSSLLWLSDNQGPIVLRLQKEMVDERKSLDDTATGRELAKNHGATWQRLHEELKGLRVSFERALEAQDRTASQLLQAQRTELQRQVAIAETAEQDLREDLESLFASKATEYQKLFFDTQNEVSELSGQVTELKKELAELKRREENEERSHVKSQERDQEKTRHNIRDRVRDKSREDHEVLAVEHQTQSAEDQLVTVQTPTEGRRFEKLQEERIIRKIQAHMKDEARRQALEKELAKKQKRKVVKRNLLSILGMMGGLATIAAGAATLQIPVVAAGIALFGSAGLKLDLSRKKKKKKEEERVWEVDDYD